MQIPKSECQFPTWKTRISRWAGPALSHKFEFRSGSQLLKLLPGCAAGKVGPHPRGSPPPPEHSLPPRMLMMRLPLTTVQPRSSWADVTESMVFSPSRMWQTLGQGPRHGVHIRLRTEWREGSGHPGPHMPGLHQAQGAGLMLLP